jgi:multiple sugar transport system ATP-binding protein
MVFQSYALYPNMNVAQNIAFGMEMRGVPKAERTQAVTEVAQMLQIDHLLKRKPHQLSGGQRQRVAMGRALVRNPQVFLFDEPLSNLDAKLRVDMRTEIKRLHQKLGTTIVYVTHDQIEAMTLAHRVAVMNHGVIQQLATPQDIYNDPDNLFVAGFIGSPAMNLIRGELVEGEFQAEGIRVPGVGRGSRRDVVFGARSEDMTVSDSGGGDIAGPIYSVELTGENTLVTLDIGGQHIVARADRFYQNDIGNNVGVRVNKARCYLFDAGSELRIRTD